MSAEPKPFDDVRVLRRSAETCFELIIRPRRQRPPSLPLPNRLLSHFLDHFCKAAGVSLELLKTDWPGSWSFDHVLCEDFGQLTGRGLAAIHDQRAARHGVRGRGRAVGGMDDALVEIVLSFEARPSITWSTPETVDIDGFVDSWYDDRGKLAGSAWGTNLRQFLEGFAHGSGATVSVIVRRSGNLHHLYESAFRALGDAVGQVLGIADTARLPGDTCGLAGAIEYSVTTAEESDVTTTE